MNEEQKKIEVFLRRETFYTRKNLSNNNKKEEE